MTKSLEQLLTLRRMREQQAEAQLQCAMARRLDHERVLERLRREERETVAEVTDRVTQLYQSCIGNPMHNADLDLLAARVDGQYRREADIHASVAAAAEIHADLSATVAAARKVVTERGRNVQKLDLILGDLRQRSDQIAEIMAESEAERPLAGPRP